MALPKLNTPTYELVLPSTGEKIKYRPFLVKEQKLLMIAKESEKYEDILRIPDYRRVDVGFSAILKSENKRSKLGFMNIFNSAWVSAEVFNLLDINNTISYLWVSDVGGRQYAVPNYLTRRQLNLKLIFKF